MRIRTSAVDLSQVKADLAICFIAEDEGVPSGLADRVLRRELQLQMKQEDFTGKSGQRLVWSTTVNSRARRILLVGLGSSHDSRALRGAVASAVRHSATYAAKSVALCLPKGSDREAVRAVTEAAQFGEYRFDKYITDPSRRAVRPTSVEIAVESPVLSVA